LLSDHALTHALEGAGHRAPVRFEEVTPSTQATALAMAAEGAPEWTLVAAAHQTEGRGRLGRRWEDERGRALLFSLVLRPRLEPARAGLLSLLAGVAMAEACEIVADQRAACRWPNDVLVAGRKAIGILAESVITADTLEVVVLGVGANLGHPPVSMPDAGAVDAEDTGLLEAFLRTFSRRYEPAHPAFDGAVVAAFRERCATLGERVRARTTDGDAVEGEAVDVDELGGLVVRTLEGARTVRFGEVEVVRGADAAPARSEPRAPE
jgi:BirA family transcriptional regulator, biotin operon repressor / biotin---[acetyl-CoA-carboxylase] ligase